jgi:hypothetical protein
MTLNWNKISGSKPKMKLRKSLAVLVLTSIGALLMTFQTAQISHAQSTTGKTQLSPDAQLNPDQLRLLRALGLKIAVPTYVPPGFKLEKVQAEVERNTRFGGVGYTLFYRRYDANSSKDFCFAIEATNGGIGDLPEGSRSYPINSPVFGKTTLEYGKYGQASNPTFLSNWLGETNGPFYHFVGAEVIPGLVRCSNVSVQEAVRVTESLRYVNP